MTKMDLDEYKESFKKQKRRYCWGSSKIKQLLMPNSRAGKMQDIEWNVRCGEEKWAKGGINKMDSNRKRCWKEDGTVR